jgi:starvation-inducible DNA-binding protein
MATATSKHFETRNDLAHETRDKVSEVLNQILADLSDLFTQTKYAHWNVRGLNFWSLHKMFDELAEKVEDSVDEVAERITALGHPARGTARMAVENSRLDEFPADTFQSTDVLKIMADRFAATAADVRKGVDEADDVGDKATSDLLTGVVEMLDQSLYFIEAHLQK